MPELASVYLQALSLGHLCRHAARQCEASESESSCVVLAAPQDRATGLPVQRRSIERASRQAAGTGRARTFLSRPPLATRGAGVATPSAYSASAAWPTSIRSGTDSGTPATCRSGSNRVRLGHQQRQAWAHLWDLSQRERHALLSCAPVSALSWLAWPARSREQRSLHGRNDACACQLILTS